MKIKYEQILDYAAERLSRQLELQYGGDPRAFVTRGMIQDWTNALADDVVEHLDTIAYHNKHGREA